MIEEKELKGGRGSHPNSRANLRPFQPGQPSANPAGRPKQAATKLLREMAANSSEGYAEGVSRLRLIVDRLLAKAEAGDLDAIKIVLDRLEGRPRQSIALDTDADAKRERKLQNFLAESEREGDPLTRAEAIAILAEEDLGFEDFE